MREGQVPGTELAADGILVRHRRRAWYGLRAGRESLGGQNPGTAKPAPTVGLLRSGFGNTTRASPVPART